MKQKLPDAITNGNFSSINSHLENEINLLKGGSKNG